MKPLSLITLLVLLNSALQAQIGFQASPGKVFFHQTAGQQGTQTVIVNNSSAGPVTLKCSLADWYRDSSGNKVYSEAGKLRHSNSRFIKLVPEMLTLKPGELSKIEISMLLPDGADTSVTNSMLFITQVEEKKLADEKVKNKEAFMKFRIQLGIHIYNEPPQLQYKNIEIAAVQLQSSQEQAVKNNALTKQKDTVTEQVHYLNATIHNNGDLVTEGSVRFELTDRATQKEYKLEALTFNSLPGDILVMPARLPAGLPKGTYFVVTMVDFGIDQPLKVAESEITIK